MLFFCIGNLLTAKVLRCCERRTVSKHERLVCYYSIKAYRFILDSGGVKMFWPVLLLNIKYWTSPGLNSIRWPGFFTTRTCRKYRKLIFLQRDFFICIVSLAIFHPHFIIRIFLSPSAAVRSSLYRDWFLANDERRTVKVINWGSLFVVKKFSIIVW